VEQGNVLLQANMLLEQVSEENGVRYYRLTITGKDNIQVTLTDVELRNLMHQVPDFLEAVIETQVLIEKPKTRRGKRNESIDIGNH